MTSRNTRRGAQIALDLPAPRPVYDQASFIVTAANRDAMELLLRFPHTEDAAMTLCGPPESGKTHLLYVAAAAAGGAVAAAAELRDFGAPPRLLAIDDAGARSGRALHALLETRRLAGLKTILAGSGRPRRWANGLRDLETRLEAMPRAELFEPDEELIEALLTRRFRALQMRIAPDLPRFVAPRIPRTFAALAAFVEAARRESADSGRAVAVPLAKIVIEKLFEAS